MSAATKLEQDFGFNGTEPDTIIAKIVPRSPELPCGRDSLGAPLSEGDPMVCLCCGARGWARVLTEEERRWDETFSYPGSSWVRVDRWLAKTLAPEAVDKFARWVRSLP